MKRIGWVGFSDGKPFFERTADTYGEAGLTLEIFKSKAKAEERYGEVREVFLSPPSTQDRGRKR